MFNETSPVKIAPIYQRRIAEGHNSVEQKVIVPGAVGTIVS